MSEDRCGVCWRVKAMPGLCRENSCPHDRAPGPEPLMHCFRLGYARLESALSDERTARRVMREALEAARKVIDRDRTGLAAGLNEVEKIVGGYRWLAAGEWGSYDYTQRTEATLRQEIGWCFDAVETATTKALRESGSLATAACRTIDAALAAEPGEGAATPEALETDGISRCIGCATGVSHDHPPEGHPRAAEGAKEPAAKQSTGCGRLIVTTLDHRRCTRPWGHTGICGEFPPGYTDPPAPQR